MNEINENTNNTLPPVNEQEQGKSMPDVSIDTLMAQEPQFFEAKKKSLDLSGLYHTLLNFIVPLGAFVGIVALLFAYILPTYRSLPDFRSELESQELLAENLTQKVAKLRNLKDFERQVKENDALLLKVLSEDAAVPELLTQIDLIVRNSGASVERLSYSTGATALSTETAYSNISVALASRSSYSQLLALLSELENAGRMVTVDTIRFSIGAAERESDGSLVSATYTLSSPFVKVSPNAVVDEPVLFDLASADFQKLMTKVKALKIYEITLEDLIIVEQGEGDEEASE